MYENGLINMKSVKEGDRAVLENIQYLDKAISEISGLLTTLEGRLDVARRHLPHPQAVEEKATDGSELANMIAAKTIVLGDIGYRMKNLLEELEI